MLPNRQKSGVFLLLGLLFGIVAAIIILVFLGKNEKTMPFRKQDISQGAQEKDSLYSNYYKNNHSKTDKIFHNFNPNADTKEELVAAGFSPGQAKTIVNYVKAGGHFSNKEDLKKLYCMNQWLYEHCSSYAVFSKSEKDKSLQSEKPTQYHQLKTGEKDKKILVLELNSCDSLDLQILKGIGPSYARRIILYREKLGGYLRKEQLMEVYGMTQELYNSITPHFSINNTNIRKININTATIKQLVHHPYIDFYLAKAIVKYRQEKGGIKSLQELKVIHLMDEQTFQKLLPYLSL